MPVNGADAWVSTTDLPALAEWLRSRKRIVVLTHVKPDGDALGSTLAATRALNRMRPASPGAGPFATPWYFGPLPDWFAGIKGDTVYRHLNEQDRAEHDHFEEPDGVLILDTGTWSQLHDVREWVMERQDRCAIIDHHKQGDADVATRRIVDTSAAAVCQPVAELCRLLLGKHGAKDLPLDIAEPLYLGMATDTGWFQHSNVTPSAMRMGADLLEAGVNHSRLFEMVEQQDRPARLRLMTRALQSLELLKNDTVAVMTLRLSDFHEARAAPTDSAGFVELALGVGSVQVSCLITEAFVHEGGGNITKVSFRSKSGPTAPDVNAVANKLGGGGHVRAAGAKVSMDLATTKKRVIEALS